MANLELRKQFRNKWRKQKRIYSYLEWRVTTYIIQYENYKAMIRILNNVYFLFE